MSDLWQVAASWPVRVAVVGGGILLVGRMLMWLTRQPARRSAIGLATVGVALLAIPLSLLPGWLPLRIAAGTNARESVAGTASKLAERHDSLAAPPLLTLREANPVAPAAPSPKHAVTPPSPGPFAESTHPATDNSRRVPPTDEGTFAPPALPHNTTTTSAATLTFDLQLATRIIVLAYGLVAVWLLVRLLIGHFALTRIWRSASMPPQWINHCFHELAAGICPRAQLRVSDRAAGPVCFGLWRPRVLVPLSLVESGDGATLQCIFAHELGHLRRRDPLTGWLLGLARAVYFVWPWLVGLRREIRLAQEYLADADAARFAAGAADYAELLVQMTRARPAPLGAAGAGGSSSELYRRVTMLLRNKGQVESRCPRHWKFAVAGGLTALAIAAAGIYVQPRPIGASEPQKKQAPKGDSIKDLIEKLKKDVGDDPDKQKQLEDLQKQVKPKTAKPITPPPLPAPAAIPNLFDPNLPEDALLKELMQDQNKFLQQMQQMLGQLQAGQQGFAFAIGPNGPIQPLRVGGVGGGRLGIRVEKPSDVLASQLDLPNGQGLVCMDVPAQSTAGKIGIKPHDILLQVAGKAVSSDVATSSRHLKRSSRIRRSMSLFCARAGRKRSKA